MNLNVEHVYKSFDKKTILQDISFSVDRGDILCLLGPSGAGKTTLIRLMLDNSLLALTGYFLLLSVLNTLSLKKYRRL